jgi:hypothetical protein
LQNPFGQSGNLPVLTRRRCTLRDETALLRELTDEIVALRELREMAIFCNASRPWPKVRNKQIPF